MKTPQDAQTKVSDSIFTPSNCKKTDGSLGFDVTKYCRRSFAGMEFELEFSDLLLVSIALKP
jgi:hypothetical protein